MGLLERLSYLFAGEGDLPKMDARLNNMNENELADTSLLRPPEERFSEENKLKEEPSEGAQPQEVQFKETKLEEIKPAETKPDDIKPEGEVHEGSIPAEAESQEVMHSESDPEVPYLEELVLGEMKNVDTKPEVIKREEPKIKDLKPEANMTITDSSPNNLGDPTFTPIIALSRFPYKYVKEEGLSQQIASRFFDKNQFWARSWDIYYHYTPASLGCRCILLTPTKDARRFLGEINRALKCTLQLPAEPDMGLILSFENEAYPQPGYLGKSTNREAKDRLQTRVPPPSERYLDPWKNMSDEHKEIAAAYETMLEAACDAAKNKRKGNAAQKQQQRMELEQRRKESLLRAQQYLGMRPAGPIDASLKYAPFNPDAVAPFAFWKDPMFISVDVEWNERCQSQITEVGISTLDMRKLHGVRPSSMNGLIWRNAIRSRHWRVREYSHIVNSEFVRGCPGDFQFGSSEFVDLAQLKAVVQGMFQQVAIAEKKKDESEDRHVVLVGHSLAADLEHLRKLGVTLEMVRDRLDTAVLDCVMHADPQQQQPPMQPRSLGAVMTEMNLEPWHLHNAGNDARYALEALVASILGYKGGN